MAGGRSINTVRGYLAALKSFSRYLAQDRIVLDKDQRPLYLLVDVKVPPLPRSRPETYKDDGLERILSAIDRHHRYGARNLGVIRLMLDGGLRLKEACRVHIDDIDWDTGRIRVRWQIAKRRKDREVWVGRRTLLELRRYLEDFRPPAATIDELFVDQDGGPLSTNAIQCVLNRLKRRLGLRKLSAHQFRRTWATNYRKHGVGDLYDLQLEGG
jgi:integrase